MSTYHAKRAASHAEIAQEMDRRGQVIEKLEAKIELLTAALRASDAHMVRMQTAATKHLTTHGRDVFINTMIYLLDGPEQREVQARIRAALQDQGVFPMPQKEGDA